MNCKWEGQVRSAPVRSTRIFSESLVRLSTAKTANAERRLVVCRLPFRPRCLSV